MSPCPCAPDFRDLVGALTASGYTPLQIADRTHYSISYVFQALRELGAGRPPAAQRRTPGYAPWMPPDVNAEARRAALERGRALALAKVAAGEWVLPKRQEVAA
jgi:hypothetical protein